MQNVRRIINVNLASLALLLVILLAFSAGFYKAAQRPLAAAFQQPAASRVPAIPADSNDQASIRSQFASSRLHTQTHAASLIELKDGRIRAFWFSGSREGAPDVEIHSAVFDPAQGKWGVEQKVADRERTQHELQRYVVKLGNPVAGRAADGSLLLYYVTVSLGGWAGSSITSMRSTDEGENWAPPRRLITSPFLNLGTLVRNAPFQYSDGSLGFPVYHEFISKFSELLRMDAHGEIMDKQRLTPGGSGTIQPVLLSLNNHVAKVMMRYSGPPPHRAISIITTDAGQHWSDPEMSEILNPDSALSAIVLQDGRILTALNNLEQGRDALSLMISADGGATWKTIYKLEDQRGQPLNEAAYLEHTEGLMESSDEKVANASVAIRNEFVGSVKQQACTPQGCRYEFSYPFLLQTQHGDFHLVYTWNRSFIKHVQFTPKWLDLQAERAR
jgi:predicted neuraminidase